VGQFDCGRMTGLNGSAGGAYLENEPDLSAPLTHEEFVSLRDCAKGLMHHTIPAEHKDRLIQLGVHTGIVGRTSTNERWQAEDCGTPNALASCSYGFSVFTSSPLNS